MFSFALVLCTTFLPVEIGKVFWDAGGPTNFLVKVYNSWALHANKVVGDKAPLVIKWFILVIILFGETNFEVITVII